MGPNKVQKDKFSRQYNQYPVQARASGGAVYPLLRMIKTKWRLLALAQVYEEEGRWTAGQHRTLPC